MKKIKNTIGDSQTISEATLKTKLSEDLMLNE
jgi:hypothetical protein